MEIIFLSFAAMVAIAGIQLLEHLAGLGPRTMSPLGVDRLTFTPTPIRRADRLTESCQELDQAA